MSLQTQTPLPSRCTGTTDRACCKREREPEWQKCLPVEWCIAAVAPLHFSTFREYEIPASRTLGYDEEFHEHIAYGEEVEAWRLSDERRLIWRIQHEDGDCQNTRGNRGFCSFSESMPR